MQEIEFINYNSCSSKQFYFKRYFFHNGLKDNEY